MTVLNNFCMSCGEKYGDEINCACIREQKMRAANEFRDQYSLSGGVIVFFGDEVCGWVNELRNPESWRPGCIALDSQGNEFEAVGGTEYSGAGEWRQRMASV